MNGKGSKRRPTNEDAYSSNHIQSLGCLHRIKELMEYTDVISGTTERYYYCYQCGIKIPKDV